MRLVAAIAVAAAVVAAGAWLAAAYAEDEPRSPFAPPKVAAPKPAAAATAPAAPGKAEAAPSVKDKALNMAARVIRGKLTPPERVKDAYLWERAMDIRVPVTPDPKTGEFETKALKLGTYNFIIRTPWGRLEGVDMEPKVSEYDVLIPPEYRTEDSGPGAGGTLSDDGRKAVRRIIYEVKRYENKIRDLALAGTSDKAVALMDLAMDEGFVGKKGDEITWRIEQWYYEKRYDAWTTFRTKVLYRFRVSGAEWRTWGWQFEPALGGFNITEDRKEPVTVEFAVPEKPAAEKGLAGNQYPPAEKGMPKEPRPPEGDQGQ